MKKYDIAVVIGRFQPIHKGHLPAFKRASELAEHVICLIGSANKPSTPKDPFSAIQRIWMIEKALHDEFGNDVTVSHYEGIEDTFYLNQSWFSKCKDVVDSFKTEEEKQIIHMLGSSDKKTLDLHMHLHGRNNLEGETIEKYLAQSRKVAVLGHVKDETSSYLEGFADWTLEDIGPWVGDSSNDHPISATDIRTLWLSGKLSYTKSNLAPSTYKTLLEWDQNHYSDLVEEFTEVKQYRKDTQVGPYVVQFLTTDAVVIHGDEVLMIRRGCHPGKGTWALPGGFKSHKETFKDSCVRELREETQIKVPEKVLRGSIKEEKMFDYPDRSSRGTTVTMAYSFVLDPSQPRPRVKGGDDAIEAWWFPINQLKKMRDQIYEDHLDIIEYMVSRL